MKLTKEQVEMIKNDAENATFKHGYDVTIVELCTDWLEMHEDGMRLAKSISSLKGFVNSSGLTFKKADGSGIGSGEALVFGQFISNIDKALNQHSALNED